MCNHHEKHLHSDGAHFLQALGFAFNSTVVNNKLEFCSPDAIGSINLYEVSAGLSMLLFDLELITKPHTETMIDISGLNSFIIFAIPIPEQISIGKQGSNTSGRLILFSSADKKMKISINAGRISKAVALIISEKWIKQECEEMGELNLLLQLPKFFWPEDSQFYSDRVAESIFQTMVTMHEYPTIHTTPAFYIKTKTVSILLDILSAVQQDRLASVQDQYFDQPRMSAIEKILEEHLKTNLPPISAIARQAVLSESTLKRNFKQMYGVSIYEYYLQKKMQLARQMLDQQPIAVKEVGYMLGYEKTSNFIKAFKKYYDLPPGSYRKRHSD